MTREQTDKKELYVEMLQRLKENTDVFKNLAEMLKEHPARAASLQGTAKLNRKLIERAERAKL